MFYVSDFVLTDTDSPDERFVEESKQVPCYHITTCAQNPFPIQHIGNLILLLFKYYDQVNSSLKNRLVKLRTGYHTIILINGSTKKFKFAK